MKPVLLFLALSSAKDPSAYKILSLADQIMEIEAQKRPAISSSPDSKDPWESHSLWQCFRTLNVQVLKETISYSYAKDLPYLQVKDDGQTFIFSLSPNENYGPREVFPRWRKLLDRATEVCILGAKFPLKKDQTKQQLWIIDQLKTKNGYWNRDDKLID